MKTKFIKVFDKENFNLNQEQIEKYVIYTTLLKEWNKRINLTAIETDEEIIYKHFLDSLLCLYADIDWQGKKIIDVGTGAGFPSLPLKIYLNNNSDFYLLDSLNKRILFLKNVIEKLNLENVYCLHGRAEDLGKNNDFREQFDVVLARAVARLPVLLELCLPLVKTGGYFIALKGPEGVKELEESKNTLDVLGGSLEKYNQFVLKGINHHRMIITFKKVAPTPLKYPRKAGIPQKRPLV